MTIEKADPISSSHFSGLSNLSGDDIDALVSILNRMKAQNFALMGLGASNHDAPEVGHHVEWKASSITGDLITLSLGAAQANGIISLVAGHTYRISVGLNIEIDSPGVGIFSIYDRTQVAVLVPDGSSLDPKLYCATSTYTGHRAPLPVGVVYFSPTVDTDIDVRVDSVVGGGSVDVVYNTSWMTIEALT